MMRKYVKYREAKERQMEQLDLGVQIHPATTHIGPPRFGGMARPLNGAERKPRPLGAPSLFYLRKPGQNLADMNDQVGFGFP